MFFRRIRNFSFHRLFMFFCNKLSRNITYKFLWIISYIIARY